MSSKRGGKWRGGRATSPITSQALGAPGKPREERNNRGMVGVAARLRLRHAP